MAARRQQRTNNKDKGNNETLFRRPPSHLSSSHSTLAMAHTLCTAAATLTVSAASASRDGGSPARKTPAAPRVILEKVRLHSLTPFTHAHARPQRQTYTAGSPAPYPRTPRRPSNLPWPPPSRLTRPLASSFPSRSTYVPFLLPSVPRLSASRWAPSPRRRSPSPRQLSCRTSTPLTPWPSRRPPSRGHDVE